MHNYKKLLLIPSLVFLTTSCSMISEAKDKVLNFLHIKGNSSETTETTNIDNGTISEDVTAKYGTFPYTEFNDYVAKLNVTVPGAYSNAEWTFGLDEDFVGEYAYATTADDGTFEQIYFNVISKSNDWVSQNDEEYTPEEYGYYYVHTTGAVDIQFFTDEGLFYLFVYPNVSMDDPDTPSSYGGFPYEELNEYVEGTGATIPGIDSDAEWLYMVGYDEYGPYGYAETEDEEGIVEVLYAAAVEATGEWISLNDESITVEEYGYIYDHVEANVEIQFFSFGGTFYLYVFVFEDEEPADYSCFDFSTTAQMIQEDGNESAWVFEDVTMTVSKGSSATSVGNGTFFSDPLRLYLGQVVTFTWENDAPTSFVATVNTTSSKSTVAAGSDTSTGFSITGGTAKASGNQITYTVNSGSNSLSFTIGSKQLHLDTIEVNY